MAEIFVPRGMLQPMTDAKMRRRSVLWGGGWPDDINRRSALPRRAAACHPGTRIISAASGGNRRVAAGGWRFAVRAGKVWSWQYRRVPAIGSVRTRQAGAARRPRIETATGQAGDKARFVAGRNQQTGRCFLDVWRKHPNFPPEIAANQGTGRRKVS